MLSDLVNPMTHLHSRTWRVLISLARVGLWIAAALSLLAATYLLYRLNKNSPVEYSRAEEHFKYGSTGGEIDSGIPLTVWVGLPRAFGLPGGDYRSFGFIYEPGHQLPIGTSKRNYRGINLVAFNCAICHVGSVRPKPNGPAIHVLGAPSNTVDLRAFYTFIFDAAQNERFSYGQIIPAAERAGVHEDLFNKLLLRYYALSLTRDGLLDFNSRLKFILSTPPFGPGRIDTFSPAKALLNFATGDRMPPAERLGVADLPSVWYQKQRRGMHLHWDGNNVKVDERNRSAAFGTGAYPTTLDRAGMRRVEQFLDTAKPEPFPFAMNNMLASEGKPIFQRLCSNCHGVDGSHFQAGQGLLGKITPIEQIGTDRHRLDSYTLALAVNQSLLYAGTSDASERFSNFRKTYGYANMPLDGIWLRAPYLHNGSVPTLRDLLEPSPERPSLFYRGDELYDAVRVGFVSNVKQRSGRPLFAFDTRVEANGNSGHEGAEYGTTLLAHDKDALIEYLKTF